MSGPNEPGQPGPGEGLGNGNGSAERAGVRPGPAANGGSSEVPPWQRGGARARQAGAPQRPAGDGPARQAGPTQNIEARVNRFITGSAAPDLSGMGGPPPPPSLPPRPEPDAPANRPEPRPEPRPETRAERTEVARPEAYASELPDLSGPTPPKPVTAPRKSVPERAADQPGRGAGAAARIQVAAGRSRGPVRANLQIRHIDPWSALKVSLLLSVSLFFVWMIAVAFLYLVLGGMGVWSKLNSNVGDLLTATSGGGGELVSSGTIFGGAALIGLVNIVLLTAMATVGAFIYNLSTDIVGGIEVTLADRD
ncbi:hypothetical protein BayCH28_25005 [Mycolicibacterium sp. CH28]|uniref:DUF3566 domain-containing protein n=1 Tax=Mycolicibacterium sp. CH28 TaxID=2512237 RepID=UPI0010822CFD|nr:DUF3566 domain-containing protein [Mycolicibacterium sp. CH28]TGD84658.1 hypothetical protein BayCH28_25005 [Mycolicibacterium sp. CH28]